MMTACCCFTEHGIFYEFIPVGEYGKEHPKTVGLDEVKKGEIMRLL